MLHHLKGDPLGYPRNPLAVYLLIVAALTGFGMLVGVTTAGTLEREVNHVAAYGWATILLGGSISTLVGMFWQGDVRTGLVLKRLGMFSVAIAAGIYGLVLGGTLGTEATWAAGTIIGFGAACFAHFLHINRRIDEIIHATQNEQDDEQVEE